MAPKRIVAFVRATPKSRALSETFSSPKEALAWLGDYREYIHSYRRENSHAKQAK